MLVIGIDPGLHTGLAVWDTSSRQLLDVRCSGIIDAMRYLRELQETRGIGLVVFEDARKRKWIPREATISEARGRAQGAGSVKRDCAIWEAICRDYRLPFDALPPKAGMTKLSADAFARLTGWATRTSNHARDAAMLVFGR